MEYQKITNLLDTTFDNVPRFITKKWIELINGFMISQVELKIEINQVNK